MNELVTIKPEDTYSYYDPRVCVIGQGQKGLLYAAHFSKKYSTTFFDLDLVHTNKSVHEHRMSSTLSNKQLQQAIRKGLTYTSDTEKIRVCNLYVITTGDIDDIDPDLRSLLHACEIVGKVISGGNGVVFDSCGSSDLIESECISMVEKVSGFTCNLDFFSGYSSGSDHRTIYGSTPEIAKILNEIYTAVLPSGTPKVYSLRETEEIHALQNSSGRRCFLFHFKGHTA